jgi:hypothetical protein
MGWRQAAPDIFLRYTIFALPYHRLMLSFYSFSDNDFVCAGPVKEGDHKGRPYQPNCFSEKQ